MSKLINVVLHSVCYDFLNSRSVKACDAIEDWCSTEPAQWLLPRLKSYNFEWIRRFDLHAMQLLITGTIDDKDWTWYQLQYADYNLV